MKNSVWVFILFFGYQPYTLKISVNYRNVEKNWHFFCTFFSLAFHYFLSCACTEFTSILNNKHPFFCKVRLALYYIIHKGNVFVICNFISAGCAIPRFYCFLSFSPSNTVALSWFCLGFVWFVCLSISFVINYWTTKQVCNVFNNSKTFH